MSHAAASFSFLSAELSLSLPSRPSPSPSPSLDDTENMPLDQNENCVTLVTLTSENDVILCFPSMGESEDESEGSHSEVVTLKGFRTYCLPKEWETEGEEEVGREEGRGEGEVKGMAKRKEEKAGKGAERRGMVMTLRIFSVNTKGKKTEGKDERKESMEDRGGEAEVTEATESRDGGGGRRWVIACGYESGDVGYCEVDTLRLSLSSTQIHTHVKSLAHRNTHHYIPANFPP